MHALIIYPVRSGCQSDKRCYLMPATPFQFNATFDNDYLALYAREAAKDRAWAKICAHVNVPEGNTATQAMAYNPKRIGMYAHEGHMTGPLKVHVPGLRSMGTFVQYGSGYAFNFLAMVISEFEGEEHVLVRTGTCTLEPEERIQYAADFTAAIARVREVVSPASLGDLLTEKTLEAAREIAQELVAAHPSVLGNGA